MDEALRIALGRALASEVVQVDVVTGGDINQAARVVLADGRRVFVKSNPGAPRALFEAEARGLSWLAEARAVNVPAVLAVGSAPAPFLALEYVERGRPVPGYDERLGRELAALHRAGAPCFGLDHDNFIGELPQSNTAREVWASFYASERLEPQLRRAEGLLSREARRAFDRLLSRLPELVGPAEPPSRLHGDLWSGNAFASRDGAPWLVDPAAYGGHREVDLAMMRLFGGFSPRAFAAYAEAFPLAPGHERRVALYQLYPLLVHVNHFGGSYVAALERTLAELA